MKQTSTACAIIFMAIHLLCVHPSVHSQSKTASTPERSLSPVKAAIDHVEMGNITAMLTKIQPAEVAFL